MKGDRWHQHQWLQQQQRHQQEFDFLVFVENP